MGLVTGSLRRQGPTISLAQANVFVDLLTIVLNTCVLHRRGQIFDHECGAPSNRAKLRQPDVASGSDSYIGYEAWRDQHPMEPGKTRPVLKVYP